MASFVFDKKVRKTCIWLLVISILVMLIGQVGAFAVGISVGKGHFAEVRVCSLPHEDRRLVIKAIDKQVCVRVHACVCWGGGGW